MKRMGIGFTTEDVELIESLRQKLRPSLGQTSIVAVIRMALRKLAADL